MDFIMEFIGEFIMELLGYIIFNKEVNIIIRILLGSVFLAGFLVIIGGLIFIIIKTESLILRIIVTIVDLILVGLLISGIRKFVLTLKKD